jgi:hypothetical protein
MEAAGLVARSRDPGNRRVHRVALTAGLQLFDRLGVAARAHDEQLRAGLDADDVARITAMLERMRRNVAGSRPVAGDEGRGAGPDGLAALVGPPSSGRPLVAGCPRPASTVTPVTPSGQGRTGVSAGPVQGAAPSP